MELENRVVLDALGELERLYNYSFLVAGFELYRVAVLVDDLNDDVCGILCNAIFGYRERLIRKICRLVGGKLSAADRAAETAAGAS